MIDFHCHLDLYPDPEAAIEAAAAAGSYVLSVTNTPSAFLGTARLALGRSRIRTALGLHPALAHKRWGELDRFDALLKTTRYVGEVGLDGSVELREHQAVQLEVLAHILRSCVRVGGRIISLHTRRAAGSTLDMLSSHGEVGIPVLHWFSGSATELRQAIGLGCWFSVGPPMLHSGRGRDLVALMPRDCVLTETDGPFGTDRRRPLQPGEVSAALSGLSMVWGEPEDEVSARLRENLRRLVQAVDTKDS